MMEYAQPPVFTVRNRNPSLARFLKGQINDLLSGSVLRPIGLVPIFTKTFFLVVGSVKLVKIDREKLTYS
jgi:hypothetical protein